METIHKVAGTILEEAVKLEVDIAPTGKIHALLQKWKWLPRQKILEIRPISLGSLTKISGILTKMDIDIIKSENLLNDYYRVVAQEGENIARVIAIAVVNRKQDPPESLVRLILDNFRPKDLINTFSIIQRQMNVMDFISSMVLIGKMNLIQTSPEDQRSSIASGPQSVA